MSDNPIVDRSTVLRHVDTRATSIVREVIRDGHNPKLIVARERRFTRDGLPAADQVSATQANPPIQKES